MKPTEPQDWSFKHGQGLESPPVSCGDVPHANERHADSLSPVDRLALRITGAVGTMGCVFVFAALALVALPSVIAAASPTLWVAWLSSQFLQLVLLPVIMVGQNLQGRHAETRAQADYEVNCKSFADVEEMLARLERIERAVARDVHDARSPHSPGAGKSPRQPCRSSSTVCEEVMREEELLERISSQLDVISHYLAKLVRQEAIMATDLTALTTAVTNETSVEQSAIVLLQHLSAQLAAAATDPAAVAAIAQQINDSAAALAAAVTANTPAAPAA